MEHRGATGTILPTLDLGRTLTLAADGDKQLRIEFRTDETIENFYPMGDHRPASFSETSSTTTQPGPSMSQMLE